MLVFCSVTRLYFWVVLFGLVYAENDTSALQPQRLFRYLNGTVMEFSTCYNTPCLMKCCPKHQLLTNLGCTNSSDLKHNDKIDFDDYFKSKVNIYNADMSWVGVKTEKKVTDFTFIYSEDISDADLILRVEFLFGPENKYYLLEDGRMKIVIINDNHFDLKPVEFCFEHEIQVYDNLTVRSTTPEAIFIILPDRSGGNGDGDEIYTIRMVVSTCLLLTSCVFMMLMLITYGLVKELRNPAGVVVMATVGSLTALFFMKVIQNVLISLNYLNTKQCGIVGIVVIYCILASFTWMNVMSYDIWSQMRVSGSHERKKLDRRSARMKFYRYCFYGWGVPLALVLLIIGIDYMDLRHLPFIIKPHVLVDAPTCFLTESSKRCYIFAPILVTIIVNIVFFLATCYNIWQVKHGIAKACADSRINKKKEMWYVLYVKLSLVTGVSWILDVMSSELYPASLVWVVVDVYNALIGLFIFITFVAKKKIIAKVCQRLRIFDSVVKKWGEPESTYLSSSRARGGSKNTSRNYSVTESIGEASVA